MVNLSRLNDLFFKSIFFMGGLYFFCFTANAQSNKTDTVLKKLNEYNQQTLQEKLFVHTDRSFYVAGEIIWFKVYCTDASNNNLSPLSKVAYVEILDKEQQPVLQGKISLKDGTGSGSFVIPSNMPSGNFLLRSYTNWMKNFDPEFYFHQNLTIVNTVKNEVFPIATAKLPDAYDVQFFPEGGNLVNELQSKVAFRVTDHSGKGIGFNGVVLDENDDSVLRFHPARFGIGNFYFTPKKEHQYHALLTTKSGNVINQTLTRALNTGFVLNVSDAITANTIKINIHTTTNDRSAFVVIHNNEKVSSSAVLRIENGSTEFQVDKSSLGDGISTVTLFNENSQPVCERLYFKNPAKHLLVDASADNREYSTRKKVTINIATKDEAAKPQPSDLSMSVFLLDSLPVTQPEIYNYFCLSSDLKGIIESPEFYFQNRNAEVDEALDNLMLTHGWRRFKWDEVLGNKKPFPKFLPEYEGHIVNAKIINKENDKPEQGITGFLSIPGSKFKLFTAKSLEDGDVYFNTTNFFGSQLIVGQADQPSYRLDFVSPFSESFSTAKVAPFSISRSLSPTLLRRSINMQVQNSFVGEKLNLLHSSVTDTFNFYRKPEARYLLDDYTRFPTMEEVLREYVREVNVRKRRGNFILSTAIKDEFDNFDIKEPVVLLDGVPQFDSGNIITHYDPLKVKQLEIIKDRYFLGPVVFDGIVSFTTYDGNLNGFRFDTASTVLDYEGLQLKREFYSPVYQNAEQYKTRMPDFRSLLYWSPEIKTAADGKKEISFYTSDIPGKYAVVLQGMSKKGNAGSKMFTIDVR